MDLYLFFTTPFSIWTNTADTVQDGCGTSTNPPHLEAAPPIHLIPHHQFTTFRRSDFNPLLKDQFTEEIFQIFHQNNLQFQCMGYGLIY